MAIALPPASTNVIVAVGFVMVADEDGRVVVLLAGGAGGVGERLASSHSAALPLWLTAGVVAVTSMRAQPTLFVARPVPAVS